MSQSCLKVPPCLTRHRHIISDSPYPQEVLPSSTEVIERYMKEDNHLTPLLAVLAIGPGQLCWRHLPWMLVCVCICRCSCQLHYSHLFWGGTRLSRVDMDTWASPSFGCIFCSHPASFHSSSDQNLGTRCLLNNMMETSVCQKGACVGSAAAASLWELTAFGSWKRCPFVCCPSAVLPFLWTPELCTALHGHTTFPLPSDAVHFSTSPEVHIFNSSTCFPSPLLIFTAQQQKPPCTTVREPVKLQLVTQGVIETHQYKEIISEQWVPEWGTGEMALETQTAQIKKSSFSEFHFPIVIFPFPALVCHIRLDSKPGRSQT